MKSVSDLKMEDLGRMSDSQNKMILSWAEHAAKPFHGMGRDESERHLRMAIGMALSVGSPVIEDIGQVEFAYAWDEDGNISVEMNSDRFAPDMLVIRGEDWR